MKPTPVPLVLRGARVLDPATGTDELADLWIDRDGVHRELPEGFGRAPDIDLHGQVVCPAFVELHAHLREPGGEGSETVATGLEAARAGGYGHVLAMANTDPVNDRPAITEGMLSSAARSGTGVRLYPVTAATRGLRGAEPALWAEQIEAGCVAISDDGKPVADPAMLDLVLSAGRELGVPYLSHAECPSLFHGPIHAGPAAAELGVEGIPSGCESDAVRAEVAAAERLGARLHVCHVSTRGSLDTLRQARERGVAVSAEATPHHLLLTDRELLERGPDPVLKMNPPLRTDEDRRALLEALEDGLVAAVATDHAPHSAAAKSGGLEGAAFGVIGMETAFAVLHEHLVLRAGWPLERLVKRLTTGPAAVAGLSAGRLFEGPPAIAVIDPGASWTVWPGTFRSLSRNCPFTGWTGRGRVAATVLGGELRPSLAPGG